MLVVATANTTGGDSTVGLPTDFLEMRDIHVNTNPITTLAYQAPNSFYNSYRATESGKPTDYSLYDRAISSITIADQSSEYSGQPMSMNYNVR